MRIALLLSLSLMLGAAACGKKKSPQSPANAAPAAESAPAGDDMKNKDAPAAGESAPSGTRSADPCEGGE